MFKNTVLQATIGASEKAAGTNSECRSLELDESLHRSLFIAMMFCNTLTLN